MSRPGPLRAAPSAGMRFFSIAVLALTISGCGALVVVDTNTGLIGFVVRGPIQPVCTPTTTCDAPFAASFHVTQDGRTIATFQSDNSGHFEVRLPPGRYQVVPDAGAPIFSPRTQVRDVVVQPDGLTEVHLEFDTGIR